MSAHLPFLISTTSILGRTHREDGRNNQDGLAVSLEPERLVAVVTDGCSSSPASEVGARLGARWLAEWVPTFLRYEQDPKALIAQVRGGLLEVVANLCTALRPHEQERPQTIQEFFLFTFLVAVVEPERTFIFGLGDGLSAVNGTANVLDADDGAPPYLAYELIRPALERDPGPLQPEILHEGPTAEIDSLVVATDGALELVPGEGGPTDGFTPLSADARFATDPEALARYLDAISMGGGLFDDTTVALLRRNG